MESGVEFVAADFPQANRLTIHILAAIAEYEAKLISERVKAAIFRSFCKFVTSAPSGPTVKLTPGMKTRSKKPFRIAGKPSLQTG